MPMTLDEALRDACRESCAAFGDPPCYELDEGEGVEFAPCADCKKVVGVAVEEPLDPNAVVAPLL